MPKFGQTNNGDFIGPSRGRGSNNWVCFFIEILEICGVLILSSCSQQNFEPSLEALHKKLFCMHKYVNCCYMWWYVNNCSVLLWLSNIYLTLLKFREKLPTKFFFERLQKRKKQNVGYIGISKLNLQKSRDKYFVDVGEFSTYFLKRHYSGHLNNQHLTASNSCKLQGRGLL